MNFSTNHQGQLTIGGVAASQLAHTFQTPLYVYDVGAIRQQIRAFKQIFEAANVDYAVSYASKAFATIAMYDVAKAENIHVDVVSGGELYTAQAAGFPMAKVSFHGNNKSKAELEQALDAGVGTIIVDNFHELDLLDELLHATVGQQNVLIRVAPGISAHTHAYDQTGQADSKFGFDLASGQADEAAKRVLADEHLNLLGIHAHIGSQIFEVAGFEAVTQKLLAVLENWHRQFGFVPQVLNVGGGFGIAYTKQDDPLPPEAFVKAILSTLKTQSSQLDWPLPAVWIEPGRSIVGPAGYSLYTVGSRKDVPGLRPYVAVDGGMGDNIRPALYQATYTAVVADHPTAKPTEHVHLVGKYCESGDILIDDAPLPATQPGDVVAVFDTGAYGYSMASNYNRNPRPAVVFVENGQAQLVVTRETYADLIQHDHHYAAPSQPAPETTDTTTAATK
ncbi:diaminopimelate decarboxylase [Lacticaseibacillus chiayiensis]|uniref:Diaminopimelate decarboxylase n=1 Tax=Lacticaseibacillus chiayiensis TaxID=2100821 RepID=A0A4Q1U6C3_9LACO|nr:diaminopimelate decarboxylase [Lacticaseibacillus chiayiensis]QVI34855.1 diaminopimelate decarboxylase [Lacticaseibacillus chiayiensis]RXT27214.1 diaminopimelate decarboxylase [Lacticaseibacillus chiayiensis]UYN56611.1 diaminopimelate decarboxylase [Lacticaseibacillus chiayiensis]